MREREKHKKTETDKIDRQTEREWGCYILLIHWHILTGKWLIALPDSLGSGGKKDFPGYYLSLGSFPRSIVDPTLSSPLTLVMNRFMAEDSRIP